MTTMAAIHSRNIKAAMLSARCIMPVLPQDTAPATNQHTVQGHQLALAPNPSQTPATAQRVPRWFHEYGQQFGRVGQEISSLPPFALGALTTKMSHPRPHRNVATHMISSVILASWLHTSIPHLVIHRLGAVLVKAPIDCLTHDCRCVKECD
jgi:hypothetical protein